MSSTVPEDAIEGAKRAYEVGQDPAAQRAFYDRWSNTYDDDFGEAGGYIYPAEVARVFLEERTASDEPVAEVGCGTGLMGEALSAGGVSADGYDISPGMLAKAAAKGAYARLVEADLTAPAPPATGYGAIISSGTFTLGHLGSDALVQVLRMGRPGALCVIGVNEKHYWQAGFDEVLGTLVANGAIAELSHRMIPIYAVPPEGDDPADRARVLIFRLAGQPGA